MLKLHQAIQDISSRFYTVQEFPLLKRDRLPAGVLKRISNVKSENVELHASRLRGLELDSLLFDLRDNPSQQELDAGLRVLRLRFSPRLLKLISILYQYNIDSDALKQACRILSLEADERNSHPQEGKFLWKFANADDIFTALRSAADQEGGNVSQCCTRWGLDPASPLARKSFFQYLSDADQRALFINESWIVSFIEKEAMDDITALIKNYLGSFDLLEYQDSVCLAIWNRLGDPYESPDWVAYTKEQRDLMAQWNFLYLLKTHTLNYPEKFEILSKYNNRIRSCKKLPEHHLLSIDFGEIVVVDVEDQPSSFFYQKQKYEEEMRRWAENEAAIPVFLRTDRKLTTARDFMIEKKEESYMKLSYIGVDRFYIQELMDIKMGIEPDMRPQKPIA